MTDTPAESAEAPRTPEEWVNTLFAASLKSGSVYDAPTMTEALVMLRASLQARDSEWREALRKAQAECSLTWVLLWDAIQGVQPTTRRQPDAHACADCAPLRALLSEGKPGK